MKNLLIFTIGPVQSFIAQARKVQDLAAGSKLLSDLIEEAMKYAREHANAKVIFPFAKEQTDYPNRFIAFIETQNAQDFGTELENYVKETVFIAKAKKSLKKYFDADKFDYAISQLNDLLKIYWVVLPNVDETNYHENYEKIERLLGGVKNLRKFEQFAETGRKCSVNGEYNVTIYRYKSQDEENKNEKLLQDKTKNKEGKQKRVLRWLEYTTNVNCIGLNNDVPLKYLSSGEGLSTISFYKRVYKTNTNFDSTCEIAYLDAINSITDENIKSSIFEIIKKDSQLLYKDNRENTDFKKAGIKKSDFKNELQKADEYFKKDIKLQKYYAVLVFDADKMGKWLSGGFLSDKKDILKFQDKLSKQLSFFAEYAKKYIHGELENEKVKKGQAIYAGGDDFLGLINLKYLFEVLENLNIKFKEFIWDNISNFNYNNKLPKDKFTFSAGVAIAHYKTPLGFVLNEARAAEQAAKEEGDRNSVAFTVLKRSGEIHKSYMKWYDNDGKFLPDNLFEIITTLKRKESSNKFITNFTQEFLPVADVIIKPELLKAELKRLLRNNDVKNLEPLVDILFNHLIAYNRNLKEFIGLLNIADFISRQINSIN